MFLYRSNRSERLVAELAQVLRRPLADPFAPESIVVQSKGMERWLALELSQRLSVFANAKFPFPRHLIEHVSELVLGEPATAAAVFERRTLAWAIAALLPELLGDPAFEPIARYLEDDRDAVLRIQLAQRIARVFDDYSVYRPELVLGWERGEEQSWDAALWRALCARLGRGHAAARAERLIAALGRTERGAFALPERVCLFGISSLPPLYVSIFAALSSHVETHCFLLSASREYFGDTRAPRSYDAAAGEQPAEGHPLLASLGVLGRELQELLEERGAYLESERDLYEPPAEDNLLHTLQADILLLRDRGGAGENAAPRARIEPDDRSLEIHVCHGAMREVEVLHDQLSAILEDPRIEPHEIAVLTPDIERYAQVIEAVFDQRGRPALPYSLADRGPRTTLEVVHALHALLDLMQSRFAASALLDLLSFECVRRRFAIASEELDTLRGWVKASGVRFCIDAEQREAIGQPALADNTWQSGLDRMLLGYALEGHGERLFQGILPLDEIEGTEAVLLGKLCELCARVFRHARAFATPMNPRASCEQLQLLLRELIDENPATLAEHELIRAALDAISEAAAAGGFDAAIGLASLQPELERAIDERLPARGLLSRGITFCQLVPMRSIPFKVVCLLGMNDDAFPGRTTRLSFDRMQLERKLGDRSRRDDDRHMFLEALLSARERVIISYVGRNIHDNRVVPPSVVVDELLDAIDRGFAPAGHEALAPGPERRAALERRLCVPQRLQAFSPRYFHTPADARLFSFAQAYCAAARTLANPRERRSLLDQPIPAAPELEALTIDELCSLVTRPLRTFLQRRLGVYLGTEAAPLPDREPMRLDPLDRWQLGTELLARMLAGAEPEHWFARARARGVLPLGSVGALEYAQLVPELEALKQRALPHREGPRLEPLAIEIEHDGVRLTGVLDGLWPSAQLCASFSRSGRRFEFEHFIKHVVLSCALYDRPRPSYPARSIVIARGEKPGEPPVEVVFEALREPQRVLRGLYALARAAQNAALPFVYEPAYAYGKALFEQERQPDDALARARKRLYDHYELDSGETLYTKLVYPSGDDLLAVQGELGFEALARRAFEAFYAHRSVP